ncbi:hypothetical protein OSB04_000529 [Centaurea solstitialis]|uniref:Uncharacterized protein n=1 Tax=Centaurea solstitialis TaxID=347529 RepID=A0AA38U8N6_9ASTR|nr:hypothetical protein OSB04_000529 [Centaurea solstitialis]
MGSSESTLLSSQGEDGITTVSERLQYADPILEKLKSLKIATPILASASTDSSSSSLTDVLVRKPSTSSNSGLIDPKVLLELFSMYQEWQEKQAQNISKTQEEIENKIEVADALALKLLRRFNYSVSAMKTASTHLTGGISTWLVHKFDNVVELGELKGRLTEVISNCDALCNRIAAGGPEPLRSTIKPFAAAASDLGTTTATLTSTSTQS